MTTETGSLKEAHKVLSGTLTYEKNDNVELAQSCRNCIFAIQEGSKQIGCKVGRLDKFKKATNVILVETKFEKVIDVFEEDESLFLETPTVKTANQYILTTRYNGELAVVTEKSELVDEGDLESLRDQELSYYILEDRYCNMYRPNNNTWSELEHVKEGLSQEVVARNEIKTKFTVVIYLDSLSTEQQLLDTLKSCEAQSLFPIEIIVLNHQHTIYVSKHLSELTIPNIKWRNSKAAAAEHEGDCFDYAMDYITGNYFVLVHAGFELPPNLLYDLDSSMNDHLQRWLLLTDPGITIAQTRLTKILSGFVEIKVEDTEYLEGLVPKIIWFCNKHNKLELVQNVKTILKQVQIGDKS